MQMQTTASIPGAVGFDRDLEIGTRVRHRRFPELLGIIREVVRLKDGRESALPYRVEWRDRTAAAAHFDPKYCDRMAAGELEVVR